MEGLLWFPSAWMFGASSFSGALPVGAVSSETRSAPPPPEVKHLEVKYLRTTKEHNLELCDHAPLQTRQVRVERSSRCGVPLDLRTQPGGAGLL